MILLIFMTFPPVSAAWSYVRNLYLFCLPSTRAEGGDDAGHQRDWDGPTSSWKQTDPVACPGPVHLWRAPTSPRRTAVLPVNVIYPEATPQCNSSSRGLSTSTIELWTPFRQNFVIWTHCSINFGFSRGTIYLHPGTLQLNCAFISTTMDHLILFLQAW